MQRAMKMPTKHPNLSIYPYRDIYRVCCLNDEFEKLHKDEQYSLVDRIWDLMNSKNWVNELQPFKQVSVTNKSLAELIETRFDELVELTLEELLYRKAVV